eukprot:2492451-Pyramimonas_sp.AAC.1
MARGNSRIPITRPTIHPLRPHLGRSPKPSGSTATRRQLRPGTHGRGRPQPNEKNSTLFENPLRRELL